MTIDEREAALAGVDDTAIRAGATVMGPIGGFIHPSAPADHQKKLERARINLAAAHAHLVLADSEPERVAATKLVGTWKATLTEQVDAVSLRPPWSRARKREELKGILLRDAERAGPRLLQLGLKLQPLVPTPPAVEAIGSEVEDVTTSQPGKEKP